MRSILTIAAGALAACAAPGAPAPGTPSPPSGPEAELQARYQQYRTGPGPHLDFETWKRLYGNPTDYSGAGP
jgi:hypothetical protein